MQCWVLTMLSVLLKALMVRTAAQWTNYVWLFKWNTQFTVYAINKHFGCYGTLLNPLKFRSNGFNYSKYDFFTMLESCVSCLTIKTVCHFTLDAVLIYFHLCLSCHTNVFQTTFSLFSKSIYVNACVFAGVWGWLISFHVYWLMQSVTKINSISAAPPLKCCSCCVHFWCSAVQCPWCPQCLRSTP